MLPPVKNTSGTLILTRQSPASADELSAEIIALDIVLLLFDPNPDVWLTKSAANFPNGPRAPSFWVIAPNGASLTVFFTSDNTLLIKLDAADFIEKAIIYLVSYTTI
jgi:hypothetical protein